jgi:hypothetical protein
LAAQSTNIYCVYNNNGAFHFCSRCFYASFDVAIEQRITVDTFPPDRTHPFRAFTSKASA